MQKKFLFLVAGIFFTASLVYATEDTAPSLDYIRSTGDGTYSLYGKNILSESWLTNIYVDDKKIESSNIAFTKDNIKLKDFYRNAGTFMIERMKVEYGSGDVAQYVTDKKTDTLKIRKNGTIGLNGTFIRDSKGGYDVITLPFIDKILSDSLFSQSVLRSERKLVVNGVEKPLVEYGGEYKDDVYYFTTQGIVFIEKNLTERVNTIGLKIDGLSSNYISVVKEGITLDNPTKIETEDVGINKSLKIFFPVPRNFNYLTNKEIFINGEKIDNNQATIGLGLFIVRYDMSKLPAYQDTLSIILKDISKNEYSNEKVIHVGTYSNLNITGIDTGKGTSTNFTFKIYGNANALFGDIYKLKININGTDYTRDGTKEFIKDGSGAVQKDTNGDDRYEIKNKIEFKKTNEGIEFEFFSSLLKDGENILFIKNENTGRESNKVSFTKSGTGPANYSYLTGSELTESAKKESLSFEIGKDFEKKINPTVMAATDRNVPIGRLKFSNLKNNEYYSLSFTIDSDLSVNPFSGIAFGTTNLETVKNGDKFSFTFKKHGFGKDFQTDTEFLATINELYNVSDKHFLLTIQEISLKKLTKENIYESVSSLKNPLKANIFYSYTNDTCFDGATKDFCSLINELDPLLTIQYSVSGAPTADVSAVATVNTGAIAKEVKKNVSYIVVQDFSNEKFRKVQDILLKKYEALKKKGSIYTPTFRKAVNGLLFSLRNIELKNKITENISQAKSAIKTLGEVLKQIKKEK